MTLAKESFYMTPELFVPILVTVTLTILVFPAFSWVLSLWLAGWLVVSRVCLLSRVSVSVRVRAGRTRPRVLCGRRIRRFTRFVRPSVRLSVRLSAVCLSVPLSRTGRN